MRTRTRNLFIDKLDDKYWLYELWLHDRKSTTKSLLFDTDYVLFLAEKSSSSLKFIMLLTDYFLVSSDIFRICVMNAKIFEKMKLTVNRFISNSPCSISVCAFSLIRLTRLETCGKVMTISLNFLAMSNEILLLAWFSLQPSDFQKGLFELLGICHNFNVEILASF